MCARVGRLLYGAAWMTSPTVGKLRPMAMHEHCPQSRALFAHFAVVPSQSFAHSCRPAWSAPQIKDKLTSAAAQSRLNTSGSTRSAIEGSLLYRVEVLEEAMEVLLASQEVRANEHRLRLALLSCAQTASRSCSWSSPSERQLLVCKSQACQPWWTRQRLGARACTRNHCEHADHHEQHANTTVNTTVNCCGRKAWHESLPLLGARATCYCFYYRTLGTINFAFG